MIKDTMKNQIQYIRNSFFWQLVEKRVFSLSLVVMISMGLSGAVIAATNFNLRLNEHTLVKARHFENASKDALIWITSEYGTRDTFSYIARTISQLGLDVWLVNLTRANQLQPSKRTLDQINPWQVSEVIKQVHQYTGKNIWLFSSEHGAFLTLRGMRYWQKQNPQKSYLGGAILLNPLLTYGIPPIGASPEYLPISFATNKPVFVIQSRYSENHWYVDEIINQLSKGHALVKYRTIAQVRERFHFRRLSTPEEDNARYKQLPPLINYAISQLRPDRRAVLAEEKMPPIKTLPNTDIPLNFSSLNRPQKISPFAFEAITKKYVSSNELRGKIVFLTFSAQWCASCRTHIKYLQKFLNKLPESKKRQVHVVNLIVDSTQEELKSKYASPIFPYVSTVAIKGETIVKYNIRKYPSTLVLDKQGKIRYSFYGSTFWRDPPVSKMINTLLPN